MMGGEDVFDFFALGDFLEKFVARFAPFFFGEFCEVYFFDEGFFVFVKGFNKLFFFRGLRPKLVIDVCDVKIFAEIFQLMKEKD